MMDLETSGFDAMHGKLQMLRAAARGDAMRSAVRAGGSVIQHEMETFAPVLDAKTAKSNALEPGELKANIRLSVAEDKQGFVVATVGPRKYISHVAYWVEFGHRLVKGGYSKMLPTGRARGPGHEVGVVPPHPFLRPAFESAATRSLQAFVEILREKIKEVVS